MTRTEIINKLLTAFAVKELVCPHTFNKFGKDSWQVFKTETLHTLYVMRFEIFKCPIIVNSYASGYSQRGSRCNMCELVKNKTLKGVSYLSSHIYGNAIDFSIKGMTGEEMRMKIIDNQNLLPYPIRLEGGVSWLHFDNNNTPNGEKIYIFKP